MAFEAQPGFPFTPEGVRRFAPRCAGLYGFRSSEEWIYIGYATGIEGRLWEHLGESWHCSGILAGTPLFFSYEPCDLEAGKALAERLIAKLRPRRNGA